MTPPESRLPGRPVEKDTSRSSAPGGCADPLLGLTLVLAEAVLGALPLLAAAMSTLAPPHGAPGGTAREWVPTVVLAAVTAVPAGLAVALLRNRWHWAGGMQVLVAVALCAAALASAVQERPDPWADRGPAPTIDPSSAGDSPPCRGGGGNGACARGGG
ncbi:DUF6234 family protein [Streptomyces sp. NPDC098077]|uniref:DUF6234 family protein n=1 Tax=Streptomyces sp. NPDC098077 TaxID=3366093 RepID=UPI003813F665